MNSDEHGTDDVPMVTLVTSPGCHFCEDARHTLVSMAARGAITLQTADATSAEGAALVAGHRPALFPLVILDGDYFSAGRLPVRKLTTALERRGVRA